MKLDVAACRRLATDAPVARLATTRFGPDRELLEIDLVPIVFAIDGESLITAVDHKPKSSQWLQRLTNITTHPEVAVLVDHYDDDWDRLWWVRLRGTARVLEPGPAHSAAISPLVAKYPQYVGRPPTGPAIVVAISVWQGWAARD